MPKSWTVLPREKPCPKEVVKTKWEKFREERGLPPRKKRGRLVYDPIQKDWVPRWGKDSIKHLAEKDDWIMAEKGRHVMAGMNPFELEKANKKKGLEKQKLAELKNKMHKAGAGKDIQILDNNNAKNSMKLKEEGQRNAIRKREAKSLQKSLALAQKSTGSMGIFDRKLKKEPEAAKSQRVEKKKSNNGLHELERSRSSEKQRNLKVLNFMARKREQELGGKVNGNMAGAAQKAANQKAAVVRAKKTKKTGKKN